MSERDLMSLSHSPLLPFFRQDAEKRISTMAFRFDKLTIKAQEAVQRAQTLAADRGHP